MKNKYKNKTIFYAAYKRAPVSTLEGIVVQRFGPRGGIKPLRWLGTPHLMVKENHDKYIFMALKEHIDDYDKDLQLHKDGVHIDLIN